MKKTIILEVEFPTDNLCDTDIRDFISTAIEDYSLETGYFGREFNYDFPRVNKILFRE